MTRRPRPSPLPTHALPRRARRAVDLTLAGMWWERLARAFWVPVTLAMLASAAAKLVWRSELAGVGWGRLMLWTAAAGAAALVAGLLVFGRDGKMASYAALVLASAASLWWVGFGARR